jgi:hypothetical protein
MRIWQHEFREPSNLIRRLERNLPKRQSRVARSRDGR